MASMSAISLLSPQSQSSSLLHDPCSKVPPILKPTVHFPINPIFPTSSLLLPPHSTRLLARGTSPVTAAASLSEDHARTLFVGNLPRKLNTADLTRIFQEHGSVEKAQVFHIFHRWSRSKSLFGWHPLGARYPYFMKKILKCRMVEEKPRNCASVCGIKRLRQFACFSCKVIYSKHTRQSLQFAFVTMKTVEDAKAVIKKLNGIKIRRHKLKINYKKRQILSAFIKSPHKVYVGNLSKRVTTNTLKQFFSDKGKVLSADILAVPGDSASSRYGVVLFTSDEDVEAAISSFNGAELEGQKIRVNKA